MAKKKKGGGGGGGGGVQQNQPASAERGVVAAPEACERAMAAAAQVEAEKKKASAGVVTAVLRVDMHCDGCAKRVRDSIRRFPGVEGVEMDVGKGTMTVVGRFDAKKLRDRVVAKTKKKVELLGHGNNPGPGGGCCKKGNETENLLEEAEKSGGCGGGKGKGGKDKQPRVPVVGTVVLRIGSVGLHCDGCKQRIRRMLFKIKGVEQVAMDMAKNQVTVTGTMDAKALPEKLRGKLRRPVDVVPPNAKKDNNNAAKEKAECCSGKEEEPCEEEARARMECMAMEALKASIYNEEAKYAPHFLSDENPNACSLM